MLLWLLGCTISKPLPFLGECANYPSDGYDYGTIEIGRCLSGVTDIHVLDGDEPRLLLVNSNPYVNFADGSLLSIAWNSIDLTTPINYSHDLESTPFALPSFASKMVITPENTGLVSVRYSEDSRTRTDEDHVYLVNLSDAANPVASTLGTGGGARIKVSSDPVDLAVDDSSAFAYVANRTSHDISIINTSTAPMKLVAPWPFEVLGEALFTDIDDSGATASLSYFSDLLTYYGDEIDEDEVDTIASLIDDAWHLKWIEGSWTIWTPDAVSGYQRWISTDAHTYTEQGWGAEFSELADVLDFVPTDIFIWGAEAYFSLNGNIAVAEWDATTAEWTIRNAALLSDSEYTLSHPNLVNTDDGIQLLVHVDDGSDSWIAQSYQDSGGNWRLGASIVTASELNVDALGGFSIVEEFGLTQWRLFIETSLDGTRQIESMRTQDWNNWTTASTFKVEDSDVGAPVVSEEADRFRMWYALGQDEVWNIAYAESIDGEHWMDFGVIQELNYVSESPPTVGVQATPISAFRFEGDSAGYQGLVELGETAVMDAFGFALQPIAGQWLDTDLFGADSAGGIRITDQVDNWTVLELTNPTGQKTIAGLDNLGSQNTWVESDETTTVSDPILWNDDGTLHLIYTQQTNGVTTVVERTSTEGFSWSEPTEILASSVDWAATNLQVTESFFVNDEHFLLVSGLNENTWSIGVATETEDGWILSETPWFDFGRPGAWDDSGTKDARIQPEGNGWRLWYAGLDGSTWRIGSAYTDNLLLDSPSSDWERSDEASIDTGWFHQTGAHTPLPYFDGTQWFVSYAGVHENTVRVGRAIGSDPAAMRPIYKAPSLGDSIDFETIKGDEERTTIPLEASVTDTTTFGIGLTDISVDSERGYLYASSKLMPHIAVIDIRDDSQGDFVDRNYLDEEARVILPTSLGSAGFRQVIPHPDGIHLIALSDSPEAVFLIDAREIEDDEDSDKIYDIQTSWLSTPVGGEEDAGVRTRTSMGPGQMLLDSNNERLFVSNFNANTISVFDLTIGSGLQIAEMDTLGENPYAMALSPDDQYLIVSNYTGDVQNDVTHGTISIFDISSTSDTQYTLATQVVNQ